MTLPDGFTFATPTAADKEAIYQFDLWTFPSKMTLEQFLNRPTPFAYERASMVLDPTSQIAGFHASYEFNEFNVPGAQIPVSGLTWVGVHPQHRRKGLLRTMITKYFADCVERGEAVAALYAAEEGIYGRFGFGRASHDARFKLGRGAAQRELAQTLNDKAGSSDLTARIELFDKATHEPIIEDLHKRAGQNINGTGLNRPGWATRETQSLRDSMHTILEDPTSAENMRIVLVERDGQTVGYSRFRRTVQWQDSGPEGTVNAGEVIALDADVSRKLWSVLTDFDLTTEITAFMVPTDDPLLQRLDDTRSIKVQHVDNVWTRIINIKEALEARQYAGNVEVVLEVTDAMIPANAGRWKLTAAAFDGPSGSRTPVVEPTEEAADIVLDIRELSTVYLGGVTLASLASADLVSATSPRALASTSVAFGWPHAPMSSWVF